MSEQCDKKRQPYRAPQITRVVLRKEQAVLSVCRSGVSNVSTMTVTQCGSSCKRVASGGNSAAPAS